MSTSTHYDVIVIGAGAAGLMAAGRAAERGKKVLLLEKNNHVGKKLSITGGGRCNILNAEEDVRSLLQNYGDAEQFLYTPFSRFGMQATRDFFERQLGLPIVIEETVVSGRAKKRAFPKSNKASDVVHVLLDWCKKHGVDIRTGYPARIEVEKNANRSTQNVITNIQHGNASYTADSYVLSTGGISHPETGSTGDGFAWLQALGHTVHAPTPTIVPLSITNDMHGVLLKSIPGTTLANAKITLYVDGAKKFAREGDILLTHFGLSGPVILNAAGKVAALLKEGEVTARIDMFPHLDLGALDARVLALCAEHKNRDVDNALVDLIPGTWVRALLKDTHKVHSLSKELRKHVIHTSKNMFCSIDGLLGLDKAVVADGGVPLNEVDTRTFCSRVVPHVYITGDLLHIRRPSGGYSLQLCWTSGYIAGSSI